MFSVNLVKYSFNNVVLDLIKSFDLISSDLIKSFDLISFLLFILKINIPPLNYCFSCFIFHERTIKYK